MLQIKEKTLVFLMLQTEITAPHVRQEEDEKLYDQNRVQRRIK